MASDHCSLSSYSRCTTKHLNLHLNVDFIRRVISGKVELTVEALEDRFSALVTFTVSGEQRCRSLEAPGALRLFSPIVYR